MDDDIFLNEIFEALDNPDPEFALYTLVDVYARASHKQRAEIRQNWDFNRRWRLPSLRTLVLDLDDEPPSDLRVRTALIYNVIEDFQPDWRDNLTRLCLIYHAAQAIDLNPDLLFEEAAAMASERGAALIRGFIARSEQEKSLSAFGWIGRETVEGIEFI